MTKKYSLPAECRFQIDFNLQMVPAAIGIKVNDAATAKMFGITEAELKQYLQDIRAENETAARILLQEAAIAEAVMGWDLPAGAKVLMTGDSITTYRYSYAHLLQSLVKLQRPADQIEIVNVAQSGYTTVHALEATYTQWLAYDPDWVFIYFGVNDCKQFGGTQAQTLIPIELYEHNLRRMALAFRYIAQAQVALITPAPVVESVANSQPDFINMHMTWDNNVIQSYAAVVAKIAGEYDLILIDFMALFGMAPEATDYVPDGLHPGPSGHGRMVQALIHSLT